MSDEKRILANAIDDYDNRHETSADKARDEEIAKIDEKHAEENLVFGSNFSKFRPMGSPIRFLEDQTQYREVGILETLNKTHEKSMKAKYDLYKARSKFYCDKTNWDKCKEETGKATDSVFKEYARKHLAELMEAREVAEFEYEQCIRVFESL